MSHLSRNLILLKNIQAGFFSSIYKLLILFAVLFNSIEKYADSQKHALENMPLFFFSLRERERDLQWNTNFIKYQWKHCQPPLFTRFFFLIYFNLSFISLLIL